MIFSGQNEGFQILLVRYSDKIIGDRKDRLKGEPDEGGRWRGHGEQANNLRLERGDEEDPVTGRPGKAITASPRLSVGVKVNQKHEEISSVTDKRENGSDRHNVKAASPAGATESHGETTRVNSSPQEQEHNDEDAEVYLQGV